MSHKPALPPPWHPPRGCASSRALCCSPPPPPSPFSFPSPPLPPSQPLRFTSQSAKHLFPLRLPEPRSQKLEGRGSRSEPRVHPAGQQAPPPVASCRPPSSSSSSSRDRGASCSAGESCWGSAPPRPPQAAATGQLRSSDPLCSSQASPHPTRPARCRRCCPTARRSWGPTATGRTWGSCPSPAACKTPATSTPGGRPSGPPSWARSAGASVL